MNERVETDVLVIGAGPAGGASSVTAARGGVRVLLVERTSMLNDPTRMLGFVPAGFEAGFDIPSIVVQQQVRGTLLRMGEEVIERRWKGFTIHIQDMCRVLAGTAGKLGADLRSGFEIESVSPQAEALFSSRTGSLEVKAKVIIACDGSFSKTARLLDLPALRHLRSYQCEASLPGAMEWIVMHLHPSLKHGWAWLYPRRTLASVGVAISSAEDPATGHRLLEWYRDLLAKSGVIGARTLYHATGAICCGGLRPCIRVGQVILAGDAAGTSHPMGMSGIASAIESGRMAGLAACAHVRGKADALRQYERDLARWLHSSHARALDRRTFMERAWDRLDFPALMRETCLYASKASRSPNSISQW